MSIIERLERATEGSRELDLEVGRSICSAELLAEYEEWGTPPVPEYTTSIDAALTLVPEGWLWRITKGKHDAEVQMQKDLLAGEFAEGAHKTTPALALTIAALKARELKEGRL